jgi:uncharacterized protein YdaU (DUF1376 family)
VNWYEHHIKDYAAAVQYHSWDEDMAYTRMIRLYYRKEQPLPGDAEEVARLIGARSPEQRAAVDTVLRDFFTLEADGLYHQEKCDGVLAEYLAGEPDREAKKANEDTRLQRHREERRDLFARLNSVGQHLPWNVGIKELRAAVAALPVSGGVSGGVQEGGQSPSDATAAATPATQPATATATPATATHSPLPTPHSPVPNSSVSQPSVALVPAAPTRTELEAGQAAFDEAAFWEAGAAPATAKPTRKRAARSSDEHDAPTNPLWRAYASTFAEVHGQEPVRERSVNAHLKTLLERLGKDDAPQVIAFYVRDRDPWYTKKLHPLELLVRDWQGIRIRWLRHRQGLPDPAVAAGLTPNRQEALQQRLNHAGNTWLAKQGIPHDRD